MTQDMKGTVALVTGATRGIDSATVLLIAGGPLALTPNQPLALDLSHPSKPPDQRGLIQ